MDGPSSKEKCCGLTFLFQGINHLKFGYPSWNISNPSKSYNGENFLDWDKLILFIIIFEDFGG